MTDTERLDWLCKQPVCFQYQTSKNWYMGWSSYRGTMPSLPPDQDLREAIDKAIERQKEGK